MPLMEHLIELRRRLIWALGITFLCCCVTFFYVDPIWAFLVAPMNDALVSTGKGTLAITEPLEGFTTLMKVAGVAGLGIASPLVFYQLWAFIAPGLYPKEKNLILPLVVSSSGLFLLGAAFCYYVVFKYAFPFFLTVTGEDVQAVLSIHSYLSMATQLLVAMGVCFQLPVVAFFLARVGLIDHKDLIAFYKYATVAIFVVAAVLTPPDVLSQFLMAIPLMGLYVISIIIARIFTTKVREPEAQPSES
jgi:sec-independent protein translocase protein TatC